MPVIVLRREIGPGWTMHSDRRGARVLAGVYETAPPAPRKVLVPDQVGALEGWAYAEWDGPTPTAVKLYVRVHE